MIVLMGINYRPANNTFILVCGSFSNKYQPYTVEPYILELLMYLNEKFNSTVASFS